MCYRNVGWKGAPRDILVQWSPNLCHHAPHQQKILRMHPQDMYIYSFTNYIHVLPYQYIMYIIKKYTKIEIKYFK